jgi:hypothetical protein
VEQASLHDGAMSDEPVPASNERVDSAQGVIPIGVVEMAVEGIGEERTDPRQRLVVEGRGVSDPDVDHEADGLTPRRAGPKQPSPDAPTFLRDWGACPRP